MTVTAVEVRPAVGASPQSGCLIWQTESHWWVTVGGLEITLAADTPVETVAAEAKALVDHSPMRVRRCVLALASTECFFAALDAAEVADFRDRSTMSFELERLFPLDAEAMVSDFSHNRLEDRWAAIGIETERHREIVDQLENHGLDVVSIVPSAFLIARGTLLWRRQRTEFELLLKQDDHYEWMSVDAEGVWRWKIVSDGQTGLSRHLALRVDEGPSPPMVVVGCDERLVDIQGPLDYCDATAGQLAVRGADESLAGVWGRWPDLRRGDLAPRDPLRPIATPLKWLSLATALALITIALSASYRGQRIGDRIAEVNEAQRTAFRDAFPDRRLPVMLIGAVRSEHRKALGSRGKGDSLRLPVPATDVLRHLYRGLQQANEEGDVRFRLLDVNITDGECSMTVRTRDAIHIGTIAKALESVGFRVDPPASEQLDPSKDEPIATYQSTIVAVWVGQTEVTGKPS